MMVYWSLFFVYFKIGLFGFGGGYAMLSLIQQEVVDRYQWISSEQFADIVAISQMTPGPIGINSATYIGYEVTQSVWGALIATFAVVLPSFILVLTVAGLLARYKDNPWVRTIFKSLRPIIVGLILAAALLLMTPGNFSDYLSVIIAAVSFLLVRYTKINPILVIIMAGMAGYIIYT